jgi:hypothetical protein
MGELQLAGICPGTVWGPCLRLAAYPPISEQRWNLSVGELTRRYDTIWGFCLRLGSRGCAKNLTGSSKAEIGTGSACNFYP